MYQQCGGTLSLPPYLLPTYLLPTSYTPTSHIPTQNNNAGTNAYSFKSLLDSDDEYLSSIVETNVLGVMRCCKEAIGVMKEQPGGGHIFNMDGAGADGNATPR